MISCPCVYIYNLHLGFKLLVFIPIVFFTNGLAVEIEVYLDVILAKRLKIYSVKYCVIISMWQSVILPNKSCAVYFSHHYTCLISYFRELCLLLFCFCETVATTDFVPRVSFHICLTSVITNCSMIKVHTSVQ